MINYTIKQKEQLLTILTVITDHLCLLSGHYVNDASNLLHEGQIIIIEEMASKIINLRNGLISDWSSND